MAENIKRIAHTAPLVTGGITSFVINLAALIDKEKFVIDNICFRDRKEFSEDLFRSYGGEKYVVDIENIKFKPLKILKKFIGTYKILKENNISVFHIDTESTDQIFLALAAKLAGVKIVIYHSHNTNSGRNTVVRKTIEIICKPLLLFFVDYYIACSEVAAKYLFPKSIIRKKQYQIVNNGIDVEKYIYNQTVRDQYRQNFAYPDKFVIGHVGRFNVQKNHIFLLDIFYEIHKKCDNAVLFLIGIGELMDSIKQKVNALGLNDCVCFFGATFEVNNLLQMMDVFLFPSLFEGLPVVGIEAQAAGLPVIASNTISEEMRITDQVEFISLEKSASYWAERCLNQRQNMNKRRNMYQEITNAGYNIEKTVQHLSKIYEGNL